MQNLKSQGNFSSGVTVLIVSGFVCKAIGALFRLPLTNLLGIEGIGIFQLVMSLYAFALVVACGGVTVSLSKLISSARASGDFQKIKSYMKSATLSSVFVGLMLGLLFAILAVPISNLQGNNAQECFYIFFLLLPLGGLLAVFRGFFQGYENMKPTAISQIIEQVFKFVFGLFFAFLLGKISVKMGVLGAFLGVTVSEVVSVIYLFFVYITKKKNAPNYAKEREKIAEREFGKTNLIITLSAVVLPLVNAFDALVIVSRLSLAGFSSSVATEFFGLQSGVVGALLNFPLVISVAVATTMLPNISYMISKGRKANVSIEKGLKILLVMILPMTFGLVAVSKILLVLLYKQMSEQLLSVAFQLMFFGAFSTIFTALLQYFFMLLQAKGEYKSVLYSMIVCGVLKAGTTFFLSSIPTINIYALVFGNILLSATGCIICLFKLKSCFSFSIGFSEMFGLILSTFLMYLCVYTFTRCEYFSSVVNLVLGILMGVVVYVVLNIPFVLKIFKRKTV